MAAITYDTGTADVKCPRCDTPIKCTVIAKMPPTKTLITPGIAQMSLTIPDLAERFAEHYREAHTAA